MAAKVWVGRFAFIDGEPHEEGPLLRSFLRQRTDEEEDELFVLVEPASPPAHEYCAQLIEAVGRMYQQDTLSITGAVLRALGTAHRQLFDWNERTLREQHVGAGVSCLAVRDRTAYLAQVGPSLAYHVGDGRFERIQATDEAAAPLGLTEQIEPALSRYELTPGDVVLISSPQLEQLIDADTLRSILLRGGDEALVELFRRARGQREFSLVLLACVVEPEAAATPVPFAEETAAAPPTPSETAAPPGAASPDAPPPALSTAASRPAAAEAPDVVPRTAVSLQAAAADTAPPTGLTHPPVRLKGAEAEVRYRRSTGMTASLPRLPPYLIVIGLLLVAAGLLAWYLIPPLLEESTTQRFNDRVHEAQTSLDKALATQDPAQRRIFLRTADSALNEAGQLRPNDPQLSDLRSRVDAALSKLNAVLALPDLALIADVSGRVPGSLSAKDLTIGGGGAYFLDRDGGRVIAISLLVPNAEPVVLYKSGELVGTELTGKPEQIAWAEGLGSLLIMDDARRVIAATPPQNGRLLPVRDANAWGSADGIAYADSDLYVLDRKGQQVWRYPPSQDGFDSEREGVLPTFDLSTVDEIAMADGLYLLKRDGAIVHVKGGVAQPFSQAGIDTALSSAGSLAPLPNLGVVLVADRGNSRIVEFGLDGTFKQQLVSPKFTDLRAVAVDEHAQLLYILAGSTLYRTPLPPLP